MRHQKDLLCIFSGKMFAGKDFVAKYANLPVRGFSDPIYELCDHFCGTHDKSVPGVRRMMQLLGQWGWGCITDEYDCNPTRAILVDAVRRHGSEMTKHFKWVNWQEFGLRQDFYVNILLSTLGLVENKTQLRLLNTRPALRIAVTNARFHHELKPFLDVGFQHFHVRCAEETRRERMLAKGYHGNNTELNDIGEQMAVRFDTDMPDEKVIWNDHRPMPSGRSFLNLDQFVEVLLPKSESLEGAPVKQKESLHTV